ncbi:MAG: hypothetical protein HW384_796 [Dehalococcoidia bacterium]|nr:hypothetical protein [Dehalococcoidia bacterium]MBF8303788.1 hypothetical protein [Dehalococcoidia bacterium]
MITRLAIYFVVGGAIIASTTYFASVGRGFVAAFVATVPTTSLLTFIFTHMEAGNAGVMAYAKGLLYFLPAWLSYALTVVFTLEKIGLVKSLVLGLVIFLALSFVTRLVVKNWMS